MSIAAELLKSLAPRRYAFGIASWGHAGSGWIAAALNEHPFIHAEYTTREAYKARFKVDDVSEIEFLLIAANNAPDKPVTGHVIGYHPNDFHTLRRRYGHYFYGAYMMGHPILRLAGSMDISYAMGRRWRFSDYMKIQGMDADNSLAKRALRLFGEDADYVPCNYIEHINAMPYYVDVNALVRFENIYASSDGMNEFVSRISGGTINDYGDRWRPHEGKFYGEYDGVAQIPLHKDPHDVWNGFPQYVQGQVSALLSNDTRIFHEKLGYDLSFIPCHLDL